MLGIDAVIFAAARALAGAEVLKSGVGHDSLIAHGFRYVK